MTCGLDNFNKKCWFCTTMVSSILSHPSKPDTWISVVGSKLVKGISPFGRNPKHQTVKALVLADITPTLT